MYNRNHVNFTASQHQAVITSSIILLTQNTVPMVFWVLVPCIYIETTRRSSVLISLWTPQTLHYWSVWEGYTTKILCEAITHIISTHITVNTSNLTEWHKTLIPIHSQALGKPVCKISTNNDSLKHIIVTTKSSTITLGWILCFHIWWRAHKLAPKQHCQYLVLNFTSHEQILQVTNEMNRITYLQ